MTKQTLILNGKKYDAVTGRLINEPVDSPSAKKDAPKKRRVEHLASAKAKKATAFQPKPSATLMRSAVKKPQKTASINAKQSVHDEKARSVQTKKSVGRIDKNRLERAKSISKNASVSRYGSSAQKFMEVRHEHVAVKTPPSKPEETDEPLGAPSPERTNKPDIFAEALARANDFVDIKAHTRRIKKQIRRHYVSMAAGFGALVLIMAFATYLNSPGLQLQVAGVQAGVTTARAHFDKTPLEVVGVASSSTRRYVDLKTSDGVTYHMIQERTNWNGQAMIEKVSSVRPDGSPEHNTRQIENQVVYQLKNGNYAWIKNGVWYQLNGGRSLSDDTLGLVIENS